MYSFGQRLNVIVSFSTTVLTFLAVGLALTSFVHNTDPEVSVDVRAQAVQTFGRTYHGGELALFTFDLDVDLSKIFTWNVKGMFVWVDIVYETPDGLPDKHPINEVTVWDRIILTPEDAKISLKNVRPEYPWISDGMQLKGATAKIRFHTSVKPYSGAIYQRTWEGNTIRVPADYTANAGSS